MCTSGHGGKPTYVQSAAVVGPLAFLGGPSKSRSNTVTPAILSGHASGRPLKGIRVRC